MAVPFESIEDEVHRLRNFILGDLSNIVRQETGGNYLAAALITCACEPLAHLKYGKENRGELFFAELLPDECKALAAPLYNAIRNGIVHLYDTQVIRVGSKRLQVVISWRDKPHLHLTPNGDYIYVNVRKLAERLELAMGNFERQLHVDAQLREVFAKGMLEGREFAVKEKERQQLEYTLGKLSIGPAFP